MTDSSQNDLGQRCIKTYYAAAGIRQTAPAISSFMYFSNDVTKALGVEEKFAQFEDANIMKIPSHITSLCQAHTKRSQLDGARFKGQILSQFVEEFISSGGTLPAGYEYDPALAARAKAEPRMWERLGNAR